MTPEVPFQLQTELKRVSLDTITKNYIVGQ